MTMSSELPEGLILPQPRPADFDPWEASDDDLIKYGLPPRPDQATNPDTFAKWEKLCSAARTFVSPGFQAQKPTDPKTGDEITRNWSGAVITASPNCSFREVWGEWVVSRPHPDNWAWMPKYWEEGHFSAGSWVGIDGHGGSHDVLQAGIGHRCTTSIHQDAVYDIHPWWEWYPEHAWTITGFQVQTGDRVDVWIRAKKPNAQSASVTMATILFCNYSACTYTSFTINAPPGTSLKGNCAEWIVEAHRKQGGHPTMSYLGATFFFNCGAWEVPTSTSTSGATERYRDATGATFLEVKQDKYNVLSTGRSDYSNAKVVGVIAEDRNHAHKVSYIH
ncbi:concanavalin A-like lectin/glucanase [Xylariaceae sp. AK1471]|nr:concanavalin A-like lectin/glucanase [Xylariaceae sp. AK1471]